MTVLDGALERNPLGLALDVIILNLHIDEEVGLLHGLGLLRGQAELNDLLNGLAERKNLCFCVSVFGKSAGPYFL